MKNLMKKLPTVVNQFSFFLKDGDSMELSIDNLGRQNIKVLAE